MKRIKQLRGHVWAILATGLLGACAAGATMDAGAQTGDAGTLSGTLEVSKGTYNGLVFEEEGMRPGRAGYFRFDVSRGGRFKGKAFIGRRHGTFHGKFDEQGAADVRVKVNTGKSNLVYYGWEQAKYVQEKRVEWTLSMQLTNGMEEVTGQIVQKDGAQWTASVLGERAGYDARSNPAPQAGKHTFIIEGTGDGTESPGGDGYGTLSVDEAGRIRLKGVLADGTAIGSAAVLSRDGYFPVYTPLYSGSGLLIGWAAFTNSPESDLAGTLLWMKLPHATQTYYPDGFTNQVMVAGSRYLRQTGGSAVLNLTNGMLVLREGDLSGSITNTVAFPRNETATGTGGVRVTINFSQATGLFRGEAEVPGASWNALFSGAVLQNRNAGFGHFLGPSRSGEVILEQAP